MCRVAPKLGVFILYSKFWGGMSPLSLERGLEGAIRTVLRPACYRQLLQ